MMSKSKMRYIFQSRQPYQREEFNRNTVPGTHGFRAWFDALHHDYVICSCGWAPHLGPHYCETAVEEEKVN
jgi:hypothetical protein